MRSPITDADIQFYREQGYFIFRQILPASLITDLRRTAANGLETARRLHGPQAQRLQDLGQHPEIGLEPVAAFAELSALNDGLAALLSPRHRISWPSVMAFLYEPAERCWGMEWHRDWRDHMNEAKFAEVFEGRWESTAVDPDLFNQINCALYDDSSTWFVPGTHRRLRDTPEEVRAMKALDRGSLENKDRSRTEAEQELALNDYLAAMPGAVSLHLRAGDLAVYRNVAWHTGAYVPYRKRATLHCSASTPEFERFVRRTTEIIAKS
ncbi:MAG: hypothetical protein JWM35_1872 [Verrucomicrobia bacterium]|nr:hypothetical protein [Verrucomicrobiota bacterium]